MKRVYVAGSYSSNNVITVLNNMRIGMRLGTQVLLVGYAPFVPWFDYQFQLMLRDGESLMVQDYYDYSMAWLEASHCMLVVPNSEGSKGTQAEIKRAIELDIPVYNRLVDLEYFEGIKEVYESA